MPRSLQLDKITGMDFFLTDPKRSLLLVQHDGSISRFDPDDNDRRSRTVKRNQNPLQMLPVVDEYFTEMAEKLSPNSLLPFLGNSVASYRLGNTLHRQLFDSFFSPSKRVEALAWDSLYNRGSFVLLAPDPLILFHILDRPQLIKAPQNLLRLGFLGLDDGELYLSSGGPLVPYFDESDLEEIAAFGRSYNDTYLTQSVHVGQCGENGNSWSRQQEAPRRVFHKGFSSNLKKLHNGRARWSLAYDPINQIQFWSDSKTGLMVAEDYQKKISSVLVSMSKRRPLQVLVEPRSGQLLWLTASVTTASWTDFRIEMSPLNGAEPWALLVNSSTLGPEPHSLFYEPELATLYWIDGHQNTIRSLKLPQLNQAPVTVVQDLAPDAHGLVVLPEAHDLSNPSPDPFKTGGPWLVWIQGGLHLMHVPVDLSGSPLKPKPVPSLTVEGLEHLIPVRRNGYANLTWHPCHVKTGVPSSDLVRGKLANHDFACSHFCTVDSSKISIAGRFLASPGPLTGIGQFTLPVDAYKCLCPPGFVLSEPHARKCIRMDTQADTTSLPRMDKCDAPNRICRAGLTPRLFRPVPQKALMDQLIPAIVQEVIFVEYLPRLSVAFRWE
ncbi:hypothetical protein Ciccas_002465 [Cichlidogyrus casuarinus]|uniref:Uncharacterized protein n=1 Tax=Cichlidogyrus casuarinus TaxID=1844966 RepID=A0ABD2QH64_9PLAT